MNLSQKTVHSGNTVTLSLKNLPGVAVSKDYKIL